VTAREKLPSAPLLLAFLCVGANGLGAIASDTIFVSTFSLGELSRFVGVSAIVRVVASFAYAALFERLLGHDPSPERAARLDAVVVGGACVTFAASALFATSDNPSILYAVCLAQLVLSPLLPLIAFNTTASALAARHAKRVLPLVAGAATVGSIAVGAAASVLAKTLGVASILGLAAVLAACAAPLLQRFAGGSSSDPRSLREPETRRAPDTRRAGAGASLRDAASDIAKIPAVRVVVAFAFFGAMATSFSDYAFKAALKASYGQADVAAVLGIFSVVSNAVVLLLQVLVTGPLVARLGVGRTLALFPSLLGAAGLAAFALPPVVGTGLARLAEVVVRYGVGNSVADVLIVPLARAIRTRAKVLVKGAASPLGALFAGVCLAAFGDAGPPRFWQLGLLAAACAALLLSVRGAPRAYAQALSTALARGRQVFDVTPEAALVFRSALRGQLEEAVRVGRFEEVRRTLDLMTDRIFELEDTRPALLARDLETRVAAVAVAARLAGPGKGGALLELVPGDSDAAVELMVLSQARERGGLADDARIAAAIQRGSSGRNASEVELWAEALLHDALAGERARNAKPSDAAGQSRVDRALKQLRKAVREPDGPQKIAALRAIGHLGDRRAEREVQLALGSKDAHVFREAARAAVRIDAPGVVAGLVARLLAGPHPQISAQALALAGPRAVRELIHALPVTRGEGSIAPTAVADGRTVSGTVRAARALARIGERASREVLPLFGELGHRARTSVARSFGARRSRVGAEDRQLVEDAVGKLESYGTTLLLQRAFADQGGKGLLEAEIVHRVEDTIGAIFDLTATLGERSVVQRARLAILGGLGGRDNALELVETLLSAPLGAKAATLMANATSAARAGPDDAAPKGQSKPPPLDGWLEKCRKYDAREIPLSDPMASVLDKVIVLRDVPLFRGLSGEDLYPVAEIASIENIDEGVDVVRQGEPSDDLYVVIEGALSVVKDGEVVGVLGAGKAFGELGVLDGEARAATVRSDASCRLLRIPRSELEALLDESPELAKGIIKVLLGYVRGAPKAS